MIFSSGSPFGPVTYNSVTYTPGQGNNAYIFPGVALGVILSGIHHISEDIFLIAAQTVAENVSQDVLERGSLYPPLSTIKECSLKIASKICQYGYDSGLSIFVFDLKGIFSENSFEFTYLCQDLIVFCKSSEFGAFLC